jgi:Domain of unknown function (DUF4845)
VNRPTERDSERGGSRLNLVLTLLVLAAMVFIAVKIVPPYFANYEFQDAVQSEARFALAGYPKKTEDDIRDDIWKKAQELSVPVKKREDIQVSLDQGNVSISTDYSVPVDLMVYQLTLEFHPHADNHSI